MDLPAFIAEFVILAKAVIPIISRAENLLLKLSTPCDTPSNENDLPTFLSWINSLLSFLGLDLF
jgi:hypothetical protein